MSSRRLVIYRRHSVRLTNAGDGLFRMALHPHSGGSGHGGEAEAKHRQRDCDWYDFGNVVSENQIRPRLEAAAFSRIHENLIV